MATIKQIDANRQNAQRSSGPRSPEGKAASRFNALKSGIDAQAQVIPGEDPAQLEALLAEYQERFDTSVPERRMLVDTLVACEWMFRRLNRAEASFWQYEAHRTESSFLSNNHPEGRVLFFGDKVFDRLQRRVNAIHRNYDRALKELKSLEDAAPTEDAQPPQSPAPPPEPPVTTPPEPAQIQSNQQPIPQIGFVPQSSEIAPQPTPAETEKLTPRDNWQPAVPACCATNDPRPPAR
jgi:hypothetical protein